MLQVALSNPFGLMYPEAAQQLGVITNEVTMELGSPTIDASGMHGGHLMNAGAIGLASVVGFSVLGAAAAGGMAALMSSAIRSKRPLLYPFLIGFGSSLIGNLVLGFFALMAARTAATAMSPAM